MVKSARLIAISGRKQNDFYFEGIYQSKKRSFAFAIHRYIYKYTYICRFIVVKQCKRMQSDFNCFVALSTPDLNRVKNCVFPC